MHKKNTNEKKKFLNLYNKMHENAKEKLIKCIKMKCIKNRKEKKKILKLC